MIMLVILLTMFYCTCDEPKTYTITPQDHLDEQDHLGGTVWPHEVYNPAEYGFSEVVIVGDNTIREWLPVYSSGITIRGKDGAKLGRMAIYD